MEALSRGIKAKVEAGAIVGCNLARGCNISHLMFVDDVLCAGEAKLSVWVAFQKIFGDFSKASGLVINQEKTELISDLVDSSVMIEIADMFGVKIRSMSGCFKYLGCKLKLNKYSILDWDWLISKFNKELSS